MPKSPFIALRLLPRRLAAAQALWLAGCAALIALAAVIFGRPEIAAAGAALLFMAVLIWPSYRTKHQGRAGDAGAPLVRISEQPLTYVSVTDIMPPMPTTTPTPPLTPAVFHILLALSDGERHGYGIMKQVEADSQGKVSMGPGTLYGSLKRMLDAGLVRESDRRVDPEMDDARRIYYEVTGAGAQALAAELERYQGIVAIAQRRRLLPGGSTNDT